MDSKAIIGLVRYFKGSPDILRAAHTKNSSALTQILKSVGVTNVTQSDLQDAYDLASAFDDSATIEARQEAAEQKARQKSQQNAQDYGDVVRNIAMMDPKTRAIYAALQVASTAAGAAGDVMQNNGNKLAEAILAANRTNSAHQNEVFGPSRRENVAGAWAAESQRKGNNAAIIGHGFSDAINKVTGMYRSEDQAARQRMMAPYDDVYMPGMSGQRFQTQWQREKAAMRMGQGD